MLRTSRNVLGILLATTVLAGPVLAQETTTSTTATDTDTIDLDAISVKGSSYKTEGSNSYTSDLVSVGEKAAVSVQDVPQSTVVITHKQIEDGNYTALETALSDTAGIMILNNNVGRSSIYSRGYEFDYLYLDGLPAPISSIYGTQPDLSIVDHIEVLKGPAGLFKGTGEPAGAINMRLKQADSDTLTGYAKTTYDSNGQARAEFDISNKLNESGTLRGRLVGAYGDGDSWVDGVTNGVKSLYGTLAWDVTPDTKLTFSYTHMERDMTPYNGLPLDSDGNLLWMDASTTTVADWNNFENNTNDLVAAAEHDFDNGSKLKFSLRRSVQDADMLYGYAASEADDGDVANYRWLARDFHQESTALDLHYDTPFLLGSWEGNAIVGADWQRVESTTYSDSGVISGIDQNLNSWNGAAIAQPDVDYGTPSTTDTTSKGLYTQLRLSPIDPLTFIGGARVSWYDGESSGSTYDVNAHLTPFAGITYDLNPDTTLYASYSEIFIPQDEVDINGNVLDPIEGRQFEAGVKARLAWGMNVSAAAFDLREVNRAEQLDASDDYYYAQGETDSRGIELTMSGEATEHLHLSGGYTYTHTKYLKGNSAGEQFSTYTPENMFKIQANYDITEGALKGWSFGGRLTTMSSFSSRGIVAPGYGVVDLMASKSWDNGLTLQAGIDNVFDRAYYTRVGSTTVFNFRGEPRTFSVGLTKKF